MAKQPDSAGYNIQHYLTLMFILEAAVNGFTSWAYVNDVSAGLSHQLDRRLRKEKEAGETEFKVTLGDLAYFLREWTDPKRREEREAEIAGLRAAPAAPKKTKDDGKASAVATQAKPTGAGGATLRAQDKDLDRLKAIFRALDVLWGQRNNTMHGNQPTVPLERTEENDGLIRQTLTLFHLLREWMKAINPEIAQSDVFGSWRYLNLTEADLVGILDSGRYRRETLIVDKSELVFFPAPFLGKYDPKDNRFGPPPHGEGTVWIATTPPQSYELRGAGYERAVVQAARGKESWGGLQGVKISALPAGIHSSVHTWHPVAPAREGGEPLFGVPAWIQTRKPTTHLRLLAIGGEPAKAPVKSRAVRPR